MKERKNKYTTQKKRKEMMTLELNAEFKLQLNNNQM